MKSQRNFSEGSIPLSLLTKNRFLVSCGTGVQKLTGLLPIASVTSGDER